MQRLAVLSLVLLAAVFTFLPRLRPSGFGWANDSVKDRKFSAYGVGVCSGAVCLGGFSETWPADYATPSPPDSGANGLFCDGRVFPFGNIAKKATGFYRWRSQSGVDDAVFAFSGVLLPAWLVAAIYAAAPVVMAVQSLRHRRIRQRAESGLCVNCGYDLRASAGRCPECGGVPLGERSLVADHQKPRKT